MRRVRRLNVHGSGNPAVHMTANSSAAIDLGYESANSFGLGIRKGSGSR